MARKINTRQQREAIPTIVGAGMTEQYYFTHLQRLLGCRIKVRPRFFGQEDIFQISKKIERVLADGGVVFAVFDADVASWDEKERAKLETMRRKYAKNPDVLICDSLPSIEYWFLLHFADVHRLFPTSQSVIKELVKFLPGFDKSKSYLENPGWVEELCAGERLQSALKSASRSGIGQSYTNIPKVMEKILP